MIDYGPPIETFQKVKEPPILPGVMLNLCITFVLVLILWKWFPVEKPLPKITPQTAELLGLCGQPPKLSGPKQQSDIQSTTSAVYPYYLGGESQP